MTRDKTTNDDEDAPSERRALVIGCGIAGPVHAIFLQRIGITPTVFEAAPGPRDEEGFWLSLAPNGLDVLATLGLAEEVIEHGIRTSSLVVQNQQGKTIGEFTDETLTIKRGVLTRILREAARERGLDIKFDKRLTDVEQSEQQGVTAHFSDGSQSHGELLIGCDGIHSQTRAAVMPDAPDPIYTGLVDSAGFTRDPSITAPQDELYMTFGYEGFFGYQVLESGEIYWFENHGRPDEPERGELDAIGNDVWHEKLLDIHERDHAPIPQIIESTREQMDKWPNYVLPEQPAWNEGRVCLIGDAAHAVNPASGQGAALAMEDAITLAKCVRDTPTIEKAFATYESVRRARTERVRKHAERSSSGKAPSNAVTRKLRDFVLPIFMRYGMKEKHEIYSFGVEWDEPISMSVNSA